MGESCALHLYVRNKDGEEVASKLFDNLVECCSTRTEAKKMYNALNSEEFKNFAIGQGVTIDEETGELDFDSLFANGLRDWIDNESYQRKIMRQYGFLNNDGTTIYKTQNASDDTLQFIQKVIDFNKNSTNSNATRGLYAVLNTDVKGRFHVRLYDFSDKSSQGKTDIPSYTKKLETYVNNMSLLKKRIVDSLGGSITRDFAEGIINNIANSFKLSGFGISDGFRQAMTFAPENVFEGIYMTLDFLSGHGVPDISSGIDRLENCPDEVKSELLECAIRPIVNVVKGDSDIYSAFKKVITDPNNRNYLFGDNGIFTSQDEAVLNGDNVEELNQFMDKAIDRILKLRFGIFPGASEKYNWPESIEQFINTLNANIGKKAYAILMKMGFDNSEEGKRLIAETKKDSNYFNDVEGIYDYTKSDYEKQRRISDYIRDARKMATDKIEQFDHFDNELKELYEDIRNAEYRRMGILREKMGISDPQRELINNDYKRIQEVIKSLNSAKGVETISSAVYRYIDDIGLRVLEFQDMIKKMNQGSYSISQKASMLRDLKEFIDVYKKLSSGIRRLILDGGTYVETVKDVALQELSSSRFNSYSNLKFDEMPEDLKLFRENMKTWDDETKMANIEYIGEKLIALKKWNLDNLDGYADLRENQEEYDAELTEDKGLIMGYVNTIKSALNGSLRERQESLAKSLDRYNAIVNNLESDYKTTLRPLITRFLDAYMHDEQRKVKFGEYMGFKKGEEITVDKLLREIDSDINVYQRLFSSLTDSPDMISNLIGEAIKRQKFEAQQDHLADVEAITREAMLLRQAGITDTEWMFEKNANGERTGFYVHSKKDEAIMEKMMKNEKIRNEFGLKDGETYVPSRHTVEENARFEERFNKFKANAEKYKTVTVEESPEYLAIMNDPAKKRFYEFFMKTYSKLQSFYPDRVVVENRIIGIRANEKEEWKNADGMMDRIKRQYHHFLDQFQSQYNDDLATMRVDPSGEEIKMLPIYFCNFKDSDIPTVTHDCISALMAYSAKAHEYNRLNDVVDSLELTKELLKERKIHRKKGGFNVVESRKRAEKQKAKGKEVDYLSLPDEGKSNISAMLDDIFDMQLYGRFHKMEGVVEVFGKKIDLGKGADWLNKRTAESALALSLTNGLSNIATGTAMMTIERFAKQFFSAEDIRWANATYFGTMGANAADIALEVAGKKRVKKNKLVLLGDLFDVQDEFMADTSDANFELNTVGRMYGELTQFMQNAGEHWMAYKTFLSVMHQYTMKDKFGNDINIYDAFEVKHFDENGNLGDEDHDIGSKAVLKEGITTKDGKPVTEETLRKIIYEIHSRTLGINHAMHGIYNSQDANAIQKYALGRMAYMFRKWIPAAIHRRFAGVHYDMDKQTWDEGYYRTCSRFMVELHKEWIRGDKTLSECWYSLEPEEIANIKRAMTEIGIFLATIVTSSLMGKWGDDDEEKKNSFAWRELKYQVWRLKSEIGSLVPWPPTMIGEMIRIFKSPMACISISEQILGIFDLLKVWNLAEEEQRGFWKGHNKWLADFLSNRAFFPKLNVIIRNTAGLEEASRQYMR